jgi:DNA ligase (NAD+)
MDKKDIIALEEKVSIHEREYREGNPTISDQDFDKLVNKLQWANPKSTVLRTFLGEVVRGEKILLPYPMGSLEKFQEIEKLYDFIIKNGLQSADFVLSPKYDGISLYTGDKAITRGDEGIEGIDVTKRFLRTSSKDYINEYGVEHRGELTILRKDFDAHNKRLGADSYSSPRSMVMSMLSSDSPDYEILKSLVYVPFDRYNNYKELDKDVIFNDIYKDTDYKTLVVSGKKILDKDIDFKAIFNDFSTDFEIDGLVIEICDFDTRNDMGFFKNSLNPKWSYALKLGFEEEKDTVIKEIQRSVSRDGRLTPVAIIEPVILCGDKVSRINLDNDRFMSYYGIGVGSKITVKKSGNVIPRLTKVGWMKILSNDEFIRVIKQPSYDPKVFQTMFSIKNNYSSALTEEIYWDENEVFLMNKSLGKDSTIRLIEHFFDTLGVQNVKGSSIGSLYDLGYMTIDRILLMDHDSLISESGWGKTKIANFKRELEKVFIANKCDIMHASGMFSGLGSTKLKIINDNIDKGWSLDNLMNLRDIGEKTAGIFFENISRFNAFYNLFEHKMNTSIDTAKPKLGEVVFSGFRSAQLVNMITNLGYIYRESLTKTTNILVYNQDATTRNKLEKAKKYGIKIMTKLEFEKLISGSVIEEQKGKDVFSNNSLF